MQGWLKGVNSGTLKENRDIGKDGLLGGTNEMVARDVYGFSLGYYEGDFKAIDNTITQTDYFMPYDNSGAGGYKNSSEDLYNGNISKMVAAIKPFLGLYGGPQGMAYKYDQLNRITHAEAWDNVSGVGNIWMTGGTKLIQYQSDYSYDGNGNITGLQRTSMTAALSAAPMDALTYHYTAGTNQLEYVDDGISSAIFAKDIDDQSAGNYSYDAIGNLISDVAEGIQNITWTLSGKIESVIKTGTDPDLEFEYDPMGNRTLKRTIPKGGGAITEILYIRDANGTKWPLIA